MKRPQAQPYRKGAARPKGATLNSMKRGKPANRPHPLDAKRKLRKNRKSIQAAVRRGRNNRA